MSLADACVVLLSLKGMALVDTYAPFMNTNAGKLFAYTLYVWAVLTLWYHKTIKSLTCLAAQNDFATVCWA